MSASKNSNSRLPDDEIAFLASLTHHQRASRLQILHKSGWTLSQLAQSIDRPKTTVHFWVRNAVFDPKMSLRPIPTPPQGITAILSTPTGVRKRPISPKVPPQVRPRLRELSEMSRRCRAKTPKGSSIALANVELTRLAVSLRSQGVPTADIASAAGVSYRAMARRIAKGAQNAR